MKKRRMRHRKEGVNPVPWTDVRGFGALSLGDVLNIHLRTMRGVLWHGVNCLGKDRCGRISLAVLIALFLAQPAARSQETKSPITVTVNKSRVFRLAERARRVSVTQPQIAEVAVVAPQELLINGKSVGTTSLVVFDEKGGIRNFDVVVMPDTEALQKGLSALFPEEKIEVSASGSAIILKGEVSNEVVYDKVLTVAETYLPPKQAEEAAPAAPSQTVTIRTPEPRLPTTGTAFAGGGELAFVEERSSTDASRWGDKRQIPGIIDLLVIKKFRQIQLNVIVAEISLTKLRELGVDFTVLGQRTGFLSLSGSQAGFPSGNLFKDPSTFPPTVTFGGATSAILSHISQRVQVATLYRLLQSTDITQILAEPTLVIKNGRSGGFLAGGEFPFPVPQTSGVGTTVTVEFKPFGVRLDFVPTLTWSDTIDLRVFPEVSEIDPSVQTLISGIQVPGLKVRRSVSRVEMKEGESLVISGLMDRRVLKDVTKFPLLGDIPFIGALFRATRFRNQETELVFVITPKVVEALKPGEKPEIPSMEKYDDPDMRQFPLPQGEKSSSDRPDRVGPTIP